MYDNNCMYSDCLSSETMDEEATFLPHSEPHIVTQVQYFIAVLILGPHSFKFMLYTRMP